MPSIKKTPPPSRLFVTFVTQKMFFLLKASLIQTQSVNYSVSVNDLLMDD